MLQQMKDDSLSEGGRVYVCGREGKEGRQGVLCYLHAQLQALPSEFYEIYAHFTRKFN